MKSFTTKIIPVQCSHQSSNAPLGPTPALESLVLRWDVVLPRDGVVSSDPSWDLFSQCPLCLLSLSRGWAHNEPGLLWALPASCLKDCSQPGDLLTDVSPLCLTSLLLQGRADLCQHLSPPTACGAHTSHDFCTGHSQPMSAARNVNSWEAHLPTGPAQSQERVHKALALTVPDLPQVLSLPPPAGLSECNPRWCTRGYCSPGGSRKLTFGAKVICCLWVSVAVNVGQD